MATDRKFCRFNSGSSGGTAAGASGLTQTSVPQGGMCLSAFVLLSEKGKRETVLLGRLDPSAPWDHIGALDAERAKQNSNGWLIPSSHLILYESPQGAAARILKEQLGLGEGVSLSGPEVVSYVYRSPRFPDGPDHWDIEFIFKGEIPRTSIVKHPAWKELTFIDTRNLKKSEMARSHEDILLSTGFKLAVD
ncbi:MAG: hypothetical protein QXP70_03780 [Methanomassiliicoccales archaeon]